MSKNLKTENALEILGIPRGSIEHAERWGVLSRGLVSQSDSAPQFELKIETGGRGIRFESYLGWLFGVSCGVLMLASLMGPVVAPSEFPLGESLRNGAFFGFSLWFVFRAVLIPNRTVLSIRRALCRS